MATFEGTGTKKLMLIAHMDTVYEQGILATQPYKVQGPLIYGPGIADDKGGLAVVLHALQILKEQDWRDYAKLTVLSNPDEEIGSIGSGELISELADQHDVVLSCEPTGAGAYDGLVLGASGTATGTMEVTARLACGRRAESRPQRADRARASIAANPGRGEIDSGHATELDHGQGRHGAQPDSGERHGRRRHSPHHSGRHRQAAGRAR
jgi:glutamate carboxypeptidase